MKLSYPNRWRSVARHAVTFLAATALLASCSRTDDLPQPADSAATVSSDNRANGTTYLGTPVRLGNGCATSFVTLNRRGKPTEIGLRLTEGALTGLPETDPGLMFSMDLPAQACATPYTHLLVDWNPTGHEPEGIYTLPHFDLHFYMTSVADREAIAPNDPLGDVLPAPAYMPVGYVPTPGTVPEMGKHWVNPLAPEFQGQTFDQTFIYGSFNGATTFIEPMFTLAYLQQVHHEKFMIPQPEAFPRAGLYYPTRYAYRYNHHDHTYEIVLYDMELR